MNGKRRDKARGNLCQSAVTQLPSRLLKLYEKKEGEKKSGRKNIILTSDKPQRHVSAARSTATTASQNRFRLVWWNVETVAVRRRVEYTSGIAVEQQTVETADPELRRSTGNAARVVPFAPSRRLLPLASVHLPQGSSQRRRCQRTSYWRLMRTASFSLCTHCANSTGAPFNIPPDALSEEHACRILIDLPDPRRG